LIELDLDPQMDKLEDLASYDGWNLIGPDDDTIGYRTKTYVTIPAPPPGGGPGARRERINLDLVAKALRALASVQLPLQQKAEIIGALSGYVPEEPPNALEDLLNEGAEYLDALQKRDSFLLAALQGLMERTAP